MIAHFRAKRFVHGDTLERVTNILNWRTAFAATLIGSVGLSEDPHNHWAALAVTAVSASALFALGLSSLSKTSPNLVSAGFALFMIAVAISLPVAMHNGTSPIDWGLRGAAPLAFLGCFFFLPVSTDDDAVVVVRAMLAATMAWSGFVAWDLIGTWPLLSTLRWTKLSGQLLLPFNVAGIALILFGPRVFPDPVRYLLLFVLAVLTLGAAYRSQEIIIAVFLIAFSAQSVLGKVERRHAIATATTLMAAGIVISAIQVGLPQASSDRIFEVGGSRVEIYVPRDGPSLAGNQPVFGKQSDMARLLEMKFALAKFLESPIVGVGLAYPVPSNLIYHGREQELARLEAVRGKQYPNVFYVHSFVVNVAMTMGLVGLTALAMVTIGAVLAFRRGWRQPVRSAAFIALSGLAVFSLIGAQYTLPQFNLMIAALAAVLVRPGGSGAAIAPGTPAN